MKTKLSKIFSTMLVVVILTSSLAATKPVSAAGWCSCLVYFQQNSGLPGTGDPSFSAYQYGDWLATHGYNVWWQLPSQYYPYYLNGKAIIFNPGAFGASSGAGHIGIVINATYSTATGYWRIAYRDANGWTSGTISQLAGPYSDSGCTNVNTRLIVSKSLSGLRFFSWSKK